MLTFNRSYFAIACFLFLIEILIALYVNDNFIRPYLGDALVVILIYCFLKSFLKISVVTAAISVLVFAFTIEYLQFLNIVKTLGLQDSRIARTVIGTSFEWIDLLMYAFGIAAVLIAENYLPKKGIHASNPLLKG